MQAKVIDQKDERYGFVGEVVYVYDDGTVDIYFDDLMGSLKYDESQIERFEKKEEK